MSERKYPAYAWWGTIFTSAALLGFAITGLVPWWTVLILAAFIMTVVVGYIEFREEKEREKTYE